MVFLSAKWAQLDSYYGNMRYHPAVPLPLSTLGSLFSTLA